MALIRANIGAGSFSKTIALLIGNKRLTIKNREVYHVPILAVAERLSDHLVGKFGLIPTRKGIKKAIKKGYVFINGQRGYTADLVYGGEHIELAIDLSTHLGSSVQVDLEVLYEDHYIAAINKPSGITVSGNQKRNITNALSQVLNKSSQADATLQPQPVHRLDHPTSGVLLIGKTRSAIRLLNQAFERRAVSKRYIAICIGHMPATGIISEPIDGKASLTKYQVWSTVSSERFRVLNLSLISPESGRKHQIRQHLHSINCPILGDKTYNDPDLILHGKGLYLHALSLSLNHPITGETMIINSAIPKRFLKIFPDAERDLAKHI